MPVRATTSITVAPAGSGKTYARGPVFLTQEFLPDEDGVHWSNLPLFPEKIAAYCSERKGLDEARTLSRIKRIDPEEERAWRNEESGPWFYFAETDLEGAHIAIDEAHTVCGRSHSLEHRRKWQEWCGELRHRGASVEFLTQHPDKLAKEVAAEAETRYRIVNGDKRRDPIFGALMGDWYEMRAAFITGKYVSAVWQFEERMVLSKWKQEQAKHWAFASEFFELYDSFDKPKSSGGRGASGVVREFERRGKPGLVWWFVRRNFPAMVPRLSLAGVLVWMGLFGGVKTVGDFLGDHIPQMGKATERTPLKLDRERRNNPNPEARNSIELKRELKAITDEFNVVKNDLLRAESVARRETERTVRLIEMLGGSGFAGVLGADAVVFAETGEYVGLGQAIRFGEHQGRMVASIDYDGRSVTLDDGTIVRLIPRDLRERLRAMAAENASNGQASVPGNLQTAREPFGQKNGTTQQTGGTTGQRGG